MRTYGYHVAVVSSPGLELREFSTCERTPYFEIPMARAISPLRDLFAVARLVQLMRRLRPAIVHAHTPKGGLLGTIAARVAGIPTRIYHVRGLPYVTMRGPKRLLLRATEWLSCKLATSVLCVSDSVRGFAVADGMVPANKIRVLAGGSGNGVDSDGTFDPKRWEHSCAQTRDELGIAQGVQVIGFVGRLVRDKGVEELHEAWVQLRETDPNVILVMVGPEEDRDRPNEGVMRQLRSDPRIRLIGESFDVARYYAIFSFLVLPTYREGFPNVVLEAGAMGIPTIATKVPGCVDAIVDGQTGLLVAAGSAPELRDAMGRYLADAELRVAHGASARVHVVQRFSRPVIWNALRQHYDHLVQRGISAGHA